MHFLNNIKYKRIYIELLNNKMYLNKNNIKKFIYFYRTINKINNNIDIFINTFKFIILNIYISTSINNNILIYCPFFNTYKICYF